MQVIDAPGTFGFGQGLGSLARILGSTAAEYQQKNALQKALDESIIDGQLIPQEFVKNSLKYGVRPNDSLTKLLELGEPSILNLKNPQAQSGDATQAQPTIYDLPETTVNQLLTSRNKQDRELGKQIEAYKQNQRKEFVQDRDYHTKQTDKYFDEVDTKRTTSRNMKSELENARMAIENRQFGMFTPDYWANVLGKYGEGLRTPEGKLLSSATKNYLLQDLQRVSGRPNMFIEQQLLDALFNPSESNANNMIVYYSNLAKQQLLDAEVSVADEIGEQDTETYGYTKRGIQKKVDERLKPIAEDIQDQLAYNIRNVLEEEEYNKNGEKGLEKLANKKVPKGTPLTENMAVFLYRKYGSDARKRASQLGYKIPTEEEYKRFKANG